VELILNLVVIALVGGIVALYAEVRAIARKVEGILSYQSFYDSQAPESPMSAVDERVIAREVEFDERIDKLRDELNVLISNQNKGLVADQLHPDVKNLNHNSINHLLSPKIEIAD
jgi:predicted Holliday junction resolvase-like endonuclease